MHFLKAVATGPVALAARASLGSCPESLVARGQARLFGVAGSTWGSVNTSLSDSSVSVSLFHASGVIAPA